MKVRNAQYVAKNIELNQEFYFAHPYTKVQINRIYNSHYSGSPLWNLFGPGALKIESSYNKSIKVMLDLPFGTHRCLIEPLTQQRHVKIILIQRFLGFMDKIDNSGKKALKMLKEEAKKDVRSVTGKNYRNIMLLAGKSCVEQVNRATTDSITYFELDEVDRWKVGFIREVIDFKNDMVDVPGFSLEEMETILKHICTV